MAPKARTLPTAEEIGTLVPIGRIAPQTPYSADFLRQLARSGKIRAFKLNRDWLTTPDAVHEYLKTQKQRHEKAISLLQTAEKAFLALALILVVVSATPRARAQSLSNPPPQGPSTMSALLHDATAGWQNFGSFYSDQLSQIPAQIKSAVLWQDQETNAALLSLGQALLGKTTDEYMVESPLPLQRSGGRLAEARIADQTGSKEQVLGVSTTRKLAQRATNKNAAMSADQIKALISQTVQAYLNSGQLTGPQGPAGPKGDPAPSTNNGITGLVNNDNGKTTAVIGGNPIVSYYPAAPANNFSGTTISGFGNLSASSFNTGSAAIQNNLTVQGSSSFVAGSFSGTLTAATSTLSSLTVSGSATIPVLGTTTIAGLTVSGPATFSGSTTIAGLTVTGLNPGLTPGSIAFQGGSGLTQDNTNFFYDQTNHRLGLGTTTPGQLLTVVGNALVTGNSTTSGNQIISGALNVTGVSTLATTTATNFTASGPASFQNTLSVTGASTLATTTITNLAVSQAPTISAFSTGLVHSNGSGLLSSAAVNLSTGDVTGLLAAGNGGTGTSTLGTLMVGSNLSITGGQNVLVGTSTQISLGSNVVTSAVNDTNLTGSITNQNLTLGWNGQLAVSRGGTGASTLTQYNLLAGNATGAIATITPGTAFQVLRSAGASAYPVYSDIGQLLTAGSNIAVTGTSTIAVAGSPSFTGTTSVATLTTTGNVGIGTTTPSQKLDVIGGSIRTDSALISPVLKPNTDSATAIQITKADGITPVLTLDTTNSKATVAGVRVFQDSNGNLAIGNSNTALQNFGGSGNTATIGIGGNAFKQFGSLIANGGQSICIGSQCGEQFTNSPYVTAVGSVAFTNSVNSANYLTGLGLGVGQFLTTANSVTVVGHHALLQTTTGGAKVALGRASLYSNKTGSNIIAIGDEADGFTPNIDPMTMTLSSGSANLGIGQYSYKIAYVFNGVTTQLSSHSQNYAPVTDSAHREITLASIPTCPNSLPYTCTARKIYRTKVGDLTESAFYLVTTLNDNTTTTFVDNVADASLGAVNADPGNWIALGTCTLNTGTAYKSGQFVVGCDTAPVNELWLGRGVWSTSTNDVLISPTGGSGTNATGANMVLSGGPSTGNVASGAIVFKAASGASSGSTWNSVNEIGRITGVGLGIGTTTPQTALSVVGSSLVDPFDVASSSAVSLFHITQGGNIGIGTSSPTSLLAVNGNALFNGNVTLTAGTVVQISGIAGNPGSPASGMVYYDSTAQKFKVVENGTVKILCNSTDLGCGTGTGSAWSAITNPTGNLALSMGSFTTAMTFGNSTANANLFTLNDSANNSGTGTLFTLSTANGSSLNPFSITASSTQALYVASGGNVGIGTTNPSVKLDVAGQVNVTSNVGPMLNVQGSINNVSIQVQNTRSGGKAWQFLTTGSGTGVLPDGSVGFRQNTDAINVMVLDKNGNVGIGSTTPTALLAIQGSSGSTTDLLKVASSTNASLFVVKSSGNVGIGLTPVYPLDVTSSAASRTGNFLNTASNGTALWATAQGGGNSNAIEGQCNTNNPTGCTAVYALHQSATGGSGWAFRALSNGNNTIDYGAYLQAQGGSSTNNYGLYSEASGNTSGTNYGGYFTASGGTNNYGLIVAAGNVGIGTTTPTLGPLTMASGAYVTSGGVWTNASDRNLKENFATMSPASILQNIDQLPITEWNYKNEDPSIKHIGPVAQDFYSIFRVGNSNTSISTIDPSGIALLGIKALDTKITALQGSLTGNATTTGQLSVYSPANFSGDSVGQAQIKTGASSVRVTFSHAYAYQPIVTISPLGNLFLTADVRYSITNVDATGFTINIAIPTPGFVTSEPVTFDWHSFASPAEQLTVSDGTTQPVQLIVANTPAGGSQASAALTVSPTPAPQAQTQPNTSSSTPQVLGVSTTTPSSDASTSASTAQSFASAPSTTTQSSSPAPSTVQTLTPPVIAPTPAASPTPAPAAVPQPSSPAPTPAPGAPAETSSPAAAAVTLPPAVPATQPSTTTDQKAASAQ